MKLKLLVLFVILLYCAANSQHRVGIKNDSFVRIAGLSEPNDLRDSLKSDTLIIPKKRKPFHFVFGSEGLGLGVTILEKIELEASTFFLFSTLSSKFFPVKDQVFPFIGVSWGREKKFYAENADEYVSRVVAFVGWRLGPFNRNRFYLDLGYKHIIHENNPNSAYDLLTFINRHILYTSIYFIVQ